MLRRKLTKLRNKITLKQPCLECGGYGTTIEVTNDNSKEKACAKCKGSGAKQPDPNLDF